LSRRYYALKAEQARLEKKVGRLTVTDTSKLHIRALETGEELHFAWRVYVPAGFKLRFEHNNGSGQSWNGSPQEFIARARIRRNDDGSWQFYLKRSGGASLSTFGGEEFSRMIDGRWDEVGIEQLAADDMVVMDSSEVACLLRLTLSDELKEEAKERLGRHLGERCQSSLMEIRFGSADAFQGIR